MNAILKYHLQDGNALTHRGKGKAVAAVPQYIQSYGMQQCYSKQLWDQALEWASHLLCVTFQRFLALFCISHHPSTHWTEVRNLMPISTLSQHRMRVHIVFQYFNFLQFKHLPSLYTCGVTKPQGNYTIKSFQVPVRQKKVCHFFLGREMIDHTTAEQFRL